MDKLPENFTRINIGGGEPTLRDDIKDIAAILSRKTKHLEISTNGCFPERLVPIVQEYPNIRIRISLEGLPKKNDEIRGLRDGFDRAMRCLLRLKELGAKDMGYAITISHRNSDELVDLYHLCAYLGIEFSQCAVHNAWQFRVPHNVIEEKEKVVNEIKNFIRELLRSRRGDYFLRIKDWYRAYLNRGLINFIRGEERLLPCGAGTDIVFIDPYGDVYPCNALKESMGNIKKADFVGIWNGSRARRVRETVSKCSQNCWMIGTSRPAMRRNIWKPSRWVLKNKIRLLLGKDIIWDIQDGQNIENKQNIRDKEEIEDRKEGKPQMIDF